MDVLLYSVPAAILVILVVVFIGFTFSKGRRQTEALDREFDDICREVAATPIEDVKQLANCLLSDKTKFSTKAYDGDPNFETGVLGGALIEVFSRYRVVDCLFTPLRLQANERFLRTSDARYLVVGETFEDGLILAQPNDDCVVERGEGEADGNVFPSIFHMLVALDRFVGVKKA